MRTGGKRVKEEGREKGGGKNEGRGGKRKAERRREERRIEREEGREGEDQGSFVIKVSLLLTKHFVLADYIPEGDRSFSLS